MQQQQWQKAVDAYRECSNRHGGKGPVAAWSMYKIYHVAYWQMEDKATAGAACEAGWEALQAPELGMLEAWVQQGRRGSCDVDVISKTARLSHCQGSNRGQQLKQSPASLPAWQQTQPLGGGDRVT